MLSSYHIKNESSEPRVLRKQAQWTYTWWSARLLTIGRAVALESTIRSIKTVPTIRHHRRGHHTSRSNFTYASDLELSWVMCRFCCRALKSLIAFLWCTSSYNPCSYHGLSSHGSQCGEHFADKFEWIVVVGSTSVCQAAQASRDYYFALICFSGGTANWYPSYCWPFLVSCELNYETSINTVWKASSWQASHVHLATVSQRFGHPDQRTTDNLSAFTRSFLQRSLVIKVPF